MTALRKPDPESDYISRREYLEGEKQSEIKHEYVDGMVYAMAGASSNHNLIAGGLFASIRSHLKGNPCQTYISDMKARVDLEGADVFYYPDVMVACDPEDKDPYFRERPKLIIEVLSSDVKADNVTKYFVYQRIETLEEYLVVSQDPTSPLAYLYRREDGWARNKSYVGLEDEIELKSIGLTLTLRDVYEDLLPE